MQEFASHARLVKCAHQSAGKTLGTGGAKMGNVHLKWAFSEAAVLFLRHAPAGKKLLGQIEKKREKGKALSILAHKIGRAVFYMLSRGTVFSMVKFRAAPAKGSGEPDVLLERVGTELAAIAPQAYAVERHEPSIRSQKSGSPSVDGMPALFSVPPPRSQDASPLPRAWR